MKKKPTVGEQFPNWSQTGSAVKQQRERLKRMAEMAAALTPRTHPKLTDYEEKVFRIFWKNYTPGVWPHDIQLEGDKRLPVVAAGFRLIKKGVLVRWQSCCWQLTELGKEMAEVRQQSPERR